jgi:hypothetical protein
LEIRKEAPDPEPPTTTSLEVLAPPPSVMIRVLLDDKDPLEMEIEEFTVTLPAFETTSVLPDPSPPMFISYEMEIDDPAPVTSVELLEDPDADPICKKNALIDPALDTISLFPLPLFPTINCQPLVTVELPLMVRRLLELLAFCPM